MNKKAVNLMICVTLAGVLGVVGLKLTAQKIKSQVILEIQKEYSPSPYGPGIDPDKLDVIKLSNEARSN